MSELIIFVGLPGSGKSTYFRDRFVSTHVHVSKDLMPNARTRDARQQKVIEHALAAGSPVVVDNTNPSIVVREPLIAMGKRHAARVIAYYFECSVAVALARNRQREGKARVPNVAIFTTAKKLVAPTTAEGFDEVHVIRCE